jgi:hypothetical protein
MTQESSTLQDFPLQASIAAVKASAAFESYDDFYRYLVESLPQNSPQTRERYAELIGRRYFPGLLLDGLLRRVWQAYQNEGLLADLMRVAALENEPVIARFVLDRVWSLVPGQVFDMSVARAFIQDTYGTFKKQSYTRLLLTLGHLGFLGRYDGEWVVQDIPVPGDALLILLHDRLAPTPRIVRVSEILDSDWWRLLGVRSADAVRGVLRQAEMAGLIARYAIVDELEQVTTRFSRDDYIVQARRL